MIHDLGKIPPQSVDLEEAILGICLVYSNSFFDVKQILNSNCFYKESHQKIFHVMECLSKEMIEIDQLTVTDKLRKLDLLDQIGGPFIISKLSGEITTNSNVIEYSKIVYQKYISRELIRIFSENTNKAFDFHNFHKGLGIVTGKQIGRASCRERV